MQTKVIGISGVSGSGKTTLAQLLSTELDATRIHWDDFDSVSQAPRDYVAWHNRGKNYSEFEYPLLATVLHDLKYNKSPWHPAHQIYLPPTEFIVFDAPLGYLHQQTGQYIDICIHIEVPLDISLARRLLRDFRSPQKTKEELLKELAFYLCSSRPLFFDSDLKETADLVVDGTREHKKQIEVIKNKLMTSEALA